MVKHLIGIDVGGTRVRIAEVNPKTGEFIGRLRTFSLEGVVDNAKLSEKISQKIKEFCTYSPKEVGLGIYAAGDIDEGNLIIKDSPNSPVKGRISFPKYLANEGYDVTITNDMKAAVQDAARYGEGKNLENVIAVTYSEGHNAALARNRKNLSQAEMGHHVYKPDGDLWCGCGQRGHLEPYVSAIGAAAMAKQYFNITRERDHPILRNAAERLKIVIEDLKEDDAAFRDFLGQIKAEDVYNTYRTHPKMNPQADIREEQVEAIKYSFGLMTSMWNPVDIIVCMGGMTKDKDILFYCGDAAIERYKENAAKVQFKTLKVPEVVVTQRKEIGVTGAVAYYLSKRGNGAKV